MHLIILAKSNNIKNAMQTKHGIAYIQSTLSNTIITITDSFGDTKSWSSSGSVGFKGSRRSTNYAAQATAENVARAAIPLGIKSVEVRIKGLGYGKPSALRGLQLGGLIITKISDVTPTPHNGCRPPKKRRV
jgi:small subunit ribosomal protein S11|uniref:Ribosomal protein S11 n=2 Tax=Characeae TaxID=3146 RepID=Q7YAL5_CHAVU|nr:ribosomal protein S11 [Chara vulgaris]AAP92191.1 ribosomal protein S11 [Chara vulgaris]WAK98771.1 ribosomal protein S11 [Chara vulgaris]